MHGSHTVQLILLVFLTCVTMHGSHTVNSFPLHWTSSQDNARPTLKLSAHPQQTTQKPQTSTVTWGLQFHPHRVCCCKKEQPSLRRLTVTSVTGMAKIRAKTLPNCYTMYRRTAVADWTTNAINHPFQFKQPNTYCNKIAFCLFRQFPVIFVPVRQ